MENFKTIEEEGRLLYKYTRGSTLYGLNTPTSDIDEGGLFIASKNTILGLSSRYVNQVSDERCDVNWYEIDKFCQMLIKSNATVLEALFVPEDKQILKPHKSLAPLFENKEQFITKDCFKPFIAYAIEQIKKARGLNKKIVNPIKERLKPLDFCYTFFNQGSTKTINWLEYRSLKQEYCGLVKIPNMQNVYGVYYDWGNFFQIEKITYDDLLNYFSVDEQIKNTSEIVSKLKNAKIEDEKVLLEKDLELSHKYNMVKFIIEFYQLSLNESSETSLMKWFDEQEVIHYRGIITENSNELRLSSVSKGERPICYFSYNENGYRKHCVDYKDYQKWVKFRNQTRYESNLKQNYDSKNMMHCMRLMTMGQEIAEGKGVILDRREAGDRDFLMNIRNHKFEYDELMEIVLKKKEELDKTIENSTLSEHINQDFINDILIDIRNNFYNMNF